MLQIVSFAVLFTILYLAIFAAFQRCEVQVNVTQTLVGPRVAEQPSIPSLPSITVPGGPFNLMSLVFVACRLLWSLIVLRLLLVGAFSTPAVENKPTTPIEKKKWFPTRIQESVPYDNVVRSLFVRQIVTETKEMGIEAIKWVVSADAAGDPNDSTTTLDSFGRLSQKISVCSVTKENGGKIGWVDPNRDDTVLPVAVVNELYRRQPKAGDIELIHNEMSDQWHVLQVSELWLNQERVLNDWNTDAQEQRIGSYGGKNQIFPKRKLKGRGVVPTLPSNLKTYTIQTAGCQMNVADSERLEGVLQNDLHLTRTDSSETDVLVLNTCSIRDHAEQKVYDALGSYAAAKRNGKQIAMIVTGCVAQQEGEKLLRRVPEIDAVVGPQYIPYLGSVLDQIRSGRQYVATAPMLLDDNDWSTPPVRGHDVRGFVNVIHGCNEHCTYCVVPSTRGMEMSRTMESIWKEIKSLRDNNYKEVTLLGQNIDAYGRDMTPKRSFADLLEYLDRKVGSESAMRIRYVTSHPRYFSDRVIDAVATLPNVCEAFHMPFQAGGDNVLASMRRGYTFASYTKIIDKIRAKAPDASISADIIVGFPGETEDEFQRTLDLMEYVKFDTVNSFAYSPRPNTEAAVWKNQIDEDVKSERLQRVQALAAVHGMERSQRYVGRVEEILVEDANPRSPQTQVMGRTRQGRQVYFDGNLAKLKGSFVQVRITEARTWSLMGELVNE